MCPACESPTNCVHNGDVDARDQPDLIKADNAPDSDVAAGLNLLCDACRSIVGRLQEAADATQGNGLEQVSPWVGSTVNSVERALILDTVTFTNGNRTHAASLLGISIRSLRNKLRDYAAEGAFIVPPPTGIGS